MREEYRSWILASCPSEYEVKETNDYNYAIHLISKQGEAIVSFQENDIIELQVNNNITNNPEFYLHFHLEHLDHAQELFKEMLKCLQHLNTNPNFKILLCCTSGLTTSFFANKLNQASELLSLHYEVNAVDINNLPNKINDYDIVLIAPQISYKYEEIKEHYPKKPIAKIPAEVFGKYDAKGIIALVYKEMKAFHKPKTEFKRNVITSWHNVLSISVYQDKHKKYIAYGLSNQGKVVDYKEVVKDNVSIEDIFDVIDTCLAKNYKLDAIGLAIAGIINADNTVVYSYFVRDKQINIVETLETRYHVKVTLFNHIKAATLGFHSLHPEHETLTCYLQPVDSCGGSGSVIKGHLVQGKGNCAGEIQFMSNHEMIFKPNEFNIINVVGDTIRNYVATIGPDMVAFYCDSLTDIEGLKEYLHQHVPTNYIPKLHKIHDLQYYILLGVTETIEMCWDEHQK